MDYTGYRLDILDDAEEFIDEVIDQYNDFESLFNEMYKSISGWYDQSHYCNSYKAKKAVADAIWDQYVLDALNGLGYDAAPVEEGPEFVDMVIRQAILLQLEDKVRRMWEDAREEYLDSDDDES